MQETIENNPNSAMLKEVAQFKQQTQGRISGKDEELPKGTSQVSASEEITEPEEKTSEEAPIEAQGDSSSESGVEPEKAKETVRVAGREFNSYEEAVKWAEEQEQQRLIAEAHAQGIREALEAQRANDPQNQYQEPQEDLESEFYANPKETFSKIQTRARDEAVAIIRQEQQKEKLWSEFLNDNPDIRRKDAERVLNEHWSTLGKITDLKIGMKELAKKVRDEYEEIYNITRPKTQLPPKKQTLNVSGGSPSGVTPNKKEEAPLSFSQQLRRMKR